MRNNNKTYILLILVLLFSLSIFSQEIKISGIVKDSLNNPLEFANVVALTKETNKLATYSITNSQGEYQISLEQGNVYTLKISFMGFETRTHDINLSTTKQDIVKNFTLTEDKNQLDEVTITYEMPVSVKGDTIVYNADTFKNGTEKKLGDILKKLPGVEINADGQIEVEGKQVKKVMVEGKDFFDGDSKLAVENIPSNAIDKVQVLKNYSEISQLNNVTNNEDNIAINLKLKEGKKNFWFGELTAGGNFSDRYLVNPKLFYYSPEKSLNIITNINNVGEIPFTRRDYFNFTGGIRNASDGSGTSLNLSTDNLGFSILKDNKANDILTKFAAVNFSFKASKSWDLSGFLLYSGTDTELIENTTTTYNTDNLVEQTEELTIQNNNLGLAKFSSSYKPNSNFQFDYDVFLKLSEQSENDALFSSYSDVNNTITTFKKDNPFSIKQNANLYYTVNDKNIFSSEIQYLISKENPFYNASFLDLGINPSSNQLPFSNVLPYNTDQENYTINQDKTIKTDRLDANVDFYHILNDNSNINVTLGNTSSKQTFNSSIFQTLDNGDTLYFTENDLNNDDVTYNFSDTFLGLKYKLTTGKFTFTPGLSLHNYNVKNEQSGVELDTNETLLLPSFYANFQLKKSESLRFTYSKTAEYADINKIAEGYVFNNYNSLFQGNSAINNGLYENYQLSYYSFSLFNYTNVFASLKYSKKKDDIKNNVVFDQINRVATPINSSLTDESLSANARWDKTFGKFKVNLKANLGLSTYYNTIDNLVNKSESFTQNYTTSFLTNFKKWPNFEIGYQRTINQYDNSNSNNSFYIDKPFANLEATLFKNLSFKADYSFYNYADKDQTLNTYSFLNANLNYQKEGSKWEYNFGVTNILNTASINQDSFNQNYSSTTEYFVQPRYGVFSIKYNL